MGVKLREKARLSKNNETEKETANSRHGSEVKVDGVHRQHVTIKYQNFPNDEFTWPIGLYGLRKSKILQRMDRHNFKKISFLRIMMKKLNILFKKDA